MTALYVPFSLDSGALIGEMIVLKATHMHTHKLTGTPNTRSGYLFAELKALVGELVLSESWR